LAVEVLSRRSWFREGRKIRLADGQTWTLPAPPKASEWKTVPFGTEYSGLIQSILEAEEEHEQRLAELALAIFLLGHNYSLSPADYERLLGFAPESPDSTKWKLAFHDIAQEHLHSYLDASRVPPDGRPVMPTPGRIARLLSWLRNHLPSRWFSFDSRGF
jgi:hypothetical protein